MSNKPDSVDIFKFMSNHIGQMCKNCCYFKYGMSLMLNTYDEWAEPDYSNLIVINKEQEPINRGDGNGKSRKKSKKGKRK